MSEPGETRGKFVTGDGRWFHRGKEARANDQPRDIVDGRMTDENRAAFQAGWDEQNALMSPPSAEQIERHNAVAAALKKWAKENLTLES